MPFMKPYMVKLLREQFPPGTRIRLDSMMNDPQPIPKGMTGTVQGIDDAGEQGQIFAGTADGRDADQRVLMRGLDRCFGFPAGFAPQMRCIT